MKFFMSGEIDVQLGDQYRLVRNEVEAKLKTLERNDYSSEFKNIGIIPIIVDPKRGLIREGFL